MPRLTRAVLTSVLALAATAAPAAAQVDDAPPGIEVIRDEIAGHAVKAVTWHTGDRRVALSTVVNPRRSAWATSDLGINTRGGFAALNGDFFQWRSGRASGLTVVGRRVVTPGWYGGPTVGYEPGGGLVFGAPRPLPITIRIDGAEFRATLKGRAPRGRVAVWNHGGARVRIPRTAMALAAADPFKGLVVPAGAHTALALHEPGTLMDRRELAVRPLAGRRFTVPRHGALLVVGRGTRPAAAVRRVLRREHPTVSASGPDRKWADVQSTMGGKPFLVRRGRARTTRPSYLGTGVWSCSCVRPVLAELRGGRGALVAIAGATIPQAARVLRRMGATDAIGFDSGGSATLWTATGEGGCSPGRRGSCFTAQPGNERHVPSATVLRAIR